MCTTMTAILTTTMIIMQAKQMMWTKMMRMVNNHMTRKLRKCATREDACVRIFSAPDAFVSRDASTVDWSAAARASKHRKEEKISRATARQQDLMKSIALKKEKDASDDETSRKERKRMNAPTNSDICWMCSDGRTRPFNAIVFCSECATGYQYGFAAAFASSVGLRKRFFTYAVSNVMACLSPMRFLPDTGNVAAAIPAKLHRLTRRPHGRPAWMTLQRRNTLRLKQAEYLGTCCVAPVGIVQEMPTGTCRYAAHPISPAHDIWNEEGPSEAYRTWALGVLKDDANFSELWHFLATFGTAMGLSELSFVTLENAFVASPISGTLAELVSTFLKCLGISSANTHNWPRHLSALISEDEEYRFDDVLKMAQRLPVLPYPSDPHDQHEPGADKADSESDEEGSDAERFDFFRQALPTKTLLLKSLCEALLVCYHKNNSKLRTYLSNLESKFACSQCTRALLLAHH
jgi:hypothetical protein